MRRPSPLAALALLAAACSHDGLALDAACYPPDPQDFGYPRLDLALGGGVGAPCTSDSDCPASATAPGRCLRDPITWPDGYCTNACRPEDNDPTTTLNPACAGARGTCVENPDSDGGMATICELSCREQLELWRCEGRYQYECRARHGGKFGLIACEALPPGYQLCNQLVAGSCGAGRTCAEVLILDSDVYSWEQPSTMTTCLPACDPLAPPSDPACRCRANRLGEGYCSLHPTTTKAPGDPCLIWSFRLDIAPSIAIEECPSGYQCGDEQPDYQGRCVRYCTPADEATQCGPCSRCEYAYHGGIGYCSGPN